MTDNSENTTKEQHPFPEPEQFLQETESIAAEHRGSSKSHKKNSNMDTVLLLLPLIPILILVLIIRSLDTSVNISSETETVETSSEHSTEEVICEDVLSVEELMDEEEKDKLLASIEEKEKFAVLLSDGSVNFRSSADSNGTDNKIGQLNDLEICDRIETEGDWYLVRHGDVTGYVHSDFCTSGDVARKEARILLGKQKSDLLKDPVVVHTEGNEIRVFSEPSANDMSLVIGRLQSGAGFTVLDETGEWLHISSGPVEGYISKNRCSKGEETLKIAQIKARNYCVVKTSILNVRTEPFYGSDNIIGTLKAGDRVTVSETDVSPSDGTGWIRIIQTEETEFGVNEYSGYINITGNNAEVYFGLASAETADARELVLENYQNPLVCITSGYVNIRESTSTDSYKNIVGKIYPGNGAELLGTVPANESKDGNKWYLISSGGVKGYVSAGTNGETWFASGDKAKEVATSYAKLTARITADCLNVRSSPSKEDNSNVWTQVTRGQAYEVIEQKGDWVKIDLGSAETENEAYISKGESFIRISYGLEEAIEFSYQEKASAFRQSIVDYACQFIGNPYVWGGNSLTKGCDCSGFVQQIMKRYGISMERSSYYQAKQGVKRTSNTMRPGDLIFYAGSNGVVNHVGIYIGGGYMVGAQSKRSGIKVVKWNYRTPVAIRDVIGDRIE